MIGTALTDLGFRKALLNGSRRSILQTFPLSGDEIETIMAIRAETLEQFASQLHDSFIAPTQDPEFAPLPQRSLRRVLP
jgi:hypothetical protein